MPSKSHTGRKLIIIFLVVGLIAATGIGVRMHNAWSLKHDTEESAIIPVSVLTPGGGPVDEELVLPGNVQAWHEAMIYARTNGYVKRWLTSMGTHVKKGQLLAEIETPEIDAQLRQADADLKTAEANNALAQTTAKRWLALLKTDSVSKQEADEKRGDARAKQAALASAKANRDHLRELSSFKQVIAPFDGIIVSRTTDIGQLVNSGSDTQQPLFRIVQADRLRIYVRVPQNEAVRINPKVMAELQLAERPGEKYKAKFLKTAEAFDATTRTLLTEFEVDNKDGKLLAGGYAEVHIRLPSNIQTLRLPVNTLIFRSGGLQLATVDATSHIVLKTAALGRDFGNEVEIASGLGAGERVVVNPPDSLTNGQEVRVTHEQKYGEKKDEPKKDAKKP